MSSNAFESQLKALVQRIGEAPLRNHEIADAVIRGDVERVLDVLLTDHAISSVFDRKNLRRIVTAFFSGETTIPGGALRARGLPGVPGRALFVITDQDDALAVASHLAPGQVWVRADLIDNWRRQWPIVEAAIRAQRAMLGAAGGKPGRPKGARLKPKEAAFLAMNPHLTGATPATEVYRAATRYGLWPDDGRSAYDQRNLRRVTRLMKRAGRVEAKSATD